MRISSCAIMEKRKGKRIGRVSRREREREGGRVSGGVRHVE